MTAIATITREKYFEHSVETGAPYASMRYLGESMRREEVLFTETASDWYDAHRVRTSEDNGRTWSDWQPHPQSWPAENGYAMEKAPVAWCHDPISKRTVRFIFHRLLAGEGAEAIQNHWRSGGQTFFDHNFWQMSEDDGRTWSDEKLLRYEVGDEFDPDKPGNENYLLTNQMYGSYSAIATSAGTIVYPAAAIPMMIGDESVLGVRCFIGTWDPMASDYNWRISAPIAVPHTVSGRGLMEPAIIELEDGRLLLEMRGSTVAIEKEWKGKTTSPGRRWMSISEDGGDTWSDVTDLRYDDGEQFYSPSTYSLLRRHSLTGKLYWFGNITPGPPTDDGPRYPLYVAEMDETNPGGPAIKRDTLTVIDDYDRDHDSPAIQLSNFSIIENRETHCFELYLTRLGERHSHWLHADAYRYTIEIKP